MARTHLIIGDGAAGIAAALAIRTSEPDARLVLVSDDAQPAYYRASLTNYLSGQLSDDELWALPADAWDALRLERVVGRVSRLDRAQRRLILDDTRALSFDRLLIATGARASTLPVALTGGAVDHRRIFVLRTLRDVKAIIERASRSRRVAVLGGGILGIEVAHGLRQRNLHVTLAHRGRWLMERVVDERAGALIQAQMQADGIDIRLNAAPASLVPTSSGERISFESGDPLDVDLVVACIGITPNTEWLKDSGLALDKGYVVVDGHMRVPGAPGVFAAGDVARVRDDAVPDVNPGGLWQPAQKQGQVAGLNMASPADASHAYRPGYIQNATKAWHLDLVTAGVHVDAEGDSLAPREQRTASGLTYKRALLRNGRLAGFMLLGDRREATALCRLMNLRGAAANVEPIKHRLFDADFDLNGWVAAQEAQPGAERWKETLFIPRGFVPPSVAAATPLRTQRSLALPGGGQTAMFSTRQKPTSRLQIASDGVMRTLEGGTLRIVGERQDTDDLVVTAFAGYGGHLEISAAGAGWLLSPRGERLPATRNGLPLTRPTFLQDCDVLQLADWKAVVRLEATQPQAQAPAGASGTAFELLGLQRHRLRGPVVMVGRSADNHVILDDASVSLFHAQLTQSAAGWYVVDSGSNAGTRVNKQPVVVPRRLSEGDTLEFGGVTLLFRAARASEPAGRESELAAPGAARAVSGPPEGYLACVSGPMAPRALPLHLPATLGRAENADVVIDDPLLSRVHARFSRTPNGVAITDLGSVNGTQVDQDKLPAGVEQRLAAGAQIRLGAHLFRFELQPPAAFLVRSWRRSGTGSQLAVGTQVFSTRGALPAEPGYELRPLDDLLGADRTPLAARGIGPHVYGRHQTEGVIRVPLKVVSERHAQIAFTGERFELRDLGSSNGTFLNGQRLGEEPRPLNDGDEVRFHVVRFRFALTRSGAAASSAVAGNDPDATSRAAAPARFDNWDQQQNPLESDLDKVVHEELDACIGCHQCMRACPLPAASSVTIAALNGYAAGVVAATPQTRKFVEDCTQCHACVPVCPVNIRRSRIVLWNKLKVTPNPAAPVVAQVADGQMELGISRADIDSQVRDFPLFQALSQDERLRALGSTRVRRLSPGETLLTEGLFVDALWVLLDGQLESGARTRSESFQRMVLLAPGQTVGDRAVLSDSSSDVTVRAVAQSVVIGIPKYTLKSLGGRNPRFQATLDGLYLARTTDAVLRACDRFRGLSDEQIRRLSRQMRAEKYQAGQVVLVQGGSARVVGVVVRGFVKQVHRRDGEEVVSNYLKAGDWLGAGVVSGPDPLLRWEAATLAEVLTVSVDSLDAIAPATHAHAAAPASTAASHANDSVMQAHRLMVIDTRTCVDCDNCVDACARRHGHSRIDRSGSSKQVGPFQIPGSCYHCEDPVCLLCAVDGIVREPTGEIRIIEDNCIGCGACAERCPYDNIRMVSTTPASRGGWSKLLPASWQRLLDGVKAEQSQVVPGAGKIASKCDLCAGYADGPACVRSCPTGAAQRIDPSTFFKDLDS